MTTINRRLLLSMAATLAAAPAFAQDATAEAPAADAPAAPEADAAAALAPRDFTLGDEAAKVKIVEYASFTCPHCANFHDTVFNRLKAEYIDTGKVHFTLREVYFDRYGFWAGLIARCDDNKRYLGISDMVFSKQREWLNSDDPTVIMNNLRTIGLTAGLTNEQLDACTANEAFGEEMLKQFNANMAADSITGTPTVILDGTKVDNWAWDNLKSLIDAKLEG
ncbi:DsbA family protein [Xinfangfangia sp. D13-10-4-6]|uniref:DsbA family protein n=1 Tax=Pseudogemmobacter hezensis TaxID=2737662 RepID=UPI001555E2FA|nr:DsbA family protein [Pseudogemmobacter hezensis]NPD14119.1 DsbA family protein [Pseudogemmobacter hezensis]